MCSYSHDLRGMSSYLRELTLKPTYTKQYHNKYMMYVKIKKKLNAQDPSET